MAEKSKITVTLLRSSIGCLPKRRACIAGLGLRKIGQTRVLEDTQAVRGMIKKVQDIVRVGEA